MEIGEFIWQVIKLILAIWVIYGFLCFCTELNKAVIAWRERNEVEKELLAVRFIIDKEWLERKSNGN
jgi:hypothetical protein